MTLAKRTTKEVLSVKDVATMCYVSPETIRRWIRLHDLPAFNTTDRRAIKIKRSDLKVFAEGCNLFVDWSAIGIKEPKG